MDELKSNTIISKNNDFVNTFDMQLFKDVKGNNGQYTALCPAHDDSSASLSIGIKNNRVLLHCHAGCSVEAILSAIGLSMSALFLDEKPRKQSTPKQKTNTITYEYHSAEGSLAYRKQRYEFNDGSKIFAFFKPNGEKGRGGKSYPYNLPAAFKAETVYFCEGEKCVDAITKAGRVATSLDAGANSIWKKEYNAYFEGKTVIILPDNDDPGMIYANKIARALPGSKIIKLPGLPKGGDIYDWLKQGHTMSEIDALPAEPPESLDPDPIISTENKTGFVEINPFETAEARQRYRWDDMGMGYLFADAYKNISRYVLEAKSWYVYDGRVWKSDLNGAIVAQQARDLMDYLLDCRRLITDDEMREKWVDFITRRRKKTSRDTMIADAQSEYPVSIQDFDKNPYMFNCQNCTLNLKDFTQHKHRPDDFLSKISNVVFDPKAKCDRWTTFINEIMQDDTDKARFLQKGLGYTLTGDTSKECFFILYGSTSRNGKGTTMETTLHIIGDYGRTTEPETITQKQNQSGGNPSEDIAGLKGARFVNISEPDKGIRLNNALVKRVTGGDSIRARFLHQNSFEFRPEFKLFINTNHLPRITDDTVFKSGRVKLIPFERHFPESEQDDNLKPFFKQPENMSGIFNWFIEGLKLLNNEGLKQPESVRAATAQYQEDSDTIGVFIRECLIEARNSNTTLKEIYKEYEQWCEENGYNPLSNKNLSTEFRRKGLKVDRGYANKVCLFGYDLTSDLPTD